MLGVVAVPTSIRILLLYAIWTAQSLDLLGGLRFLKLNESSHRGYVEYLGLVSSRRSLQENNCVVKFALPRPQATLSADDGDDRYPIPNQYQWHQTSTGRIIFGSIRNLDNRTRTYTTHTNATHGIGIVPTVYSPMLLVTLLIAP